MLNYADLKNRPKELLAATGLKGEAFEGLLVAFREAYRRQYAECTVEGQRRQRAAGGGSKGKLSRMEDQRLLILVYEKTYPLQTLLGLQFGLSQGRANQWIQRLMPLLQQALADLGMRPARAAADVADNELVQAGGADVLIDGTERRRQRPQDELVQREVYSGKKRRTPTKTSS